MGTIAKFYDLEASKLIADGEKVALFTKHPGALGAFREARLRQYLIDHVPDGYKVSSGFISHADIASHDISDTSSKQIDCLVYECANQAALLEAADFVCIEAKNAAAIVEIKSTLGIHRAYAPNKGSPSEKYPYDEGGLGYCWAGTLVDALANIKSAIDVMAASGKKREDYHASIFAYDGNTLNQLETALTSGELTKQLDISSLDQLPDCVCVLTSGWWSFEAYEDIEHPEYGLPDYDDQKSWLNKTVGNDLKGFPLQCFTAYFSRLLEGQTGVTPSVGGMRSAVGRTWQSKNTQFDLPCPGRG